MQSCHVMHIINSLVLNGEYFSIVVLVNRQQIFKTMAIQVLDLKQPMPTWCPLAVLDYNPYKCHPAKTSEGSQFGDG